MPSAVEPKTRKGILAFGIVWIGQVISFIGSGMSRFALGVWIYQKSKIPWWMRNFSNSFNLFVKTILLSYCNNSTNRRG